MHTAQQLCANLDANARDDAILARQARNDPQAFSELYDRYLDRVYRFILVRTGNTDDAQDLTSQTFLAALENIGQYTGRGDFGGWLFSIARHKIADHYRRRSDLPLEKAESLHHSGPEPEEIVHATLQLARVARALRSLDAQQAEAIALRLFGELDTAQVAQVMGKSQAAIKMLVYRGLRQLQERLMLTRSEKADLPLEVSR